MAAVAAAIPSVAARRIATRATSSYPLTRTLPSRTGVAPRTTATRSRRCDSVWSQYATGASSSSVTPSALAHSSAGSSHSPPNRPFGSRRASTTSPPASSHIKVRARTGSSLSRLRGAVTGSSACRPDFAAAHQLATGHARQRGAVGEHRVAPSSITPWLRSPGAAASGSAVINSPARCHRARWPAVDLMSSPIA
jgi:hypothetical protein